MAEVIPIKIVQGETFEWGFLWTDNEPRQVHITGMPSKVPLRLTVAGHGLPDGWPFWVSCVKAPEELNTAVSSPRAEEVMEAEPLWAKPVDADTIEVPGVVAGCWRPFSGPGVLITRTPLDLAGWQCRGQVRDKAGGRLLWSWHSDPAENPDSLIIVDHALSQFVLTMSAEQAAGLTWNRGVYEIEAVSPGGEVFKVTAPSPIEVAREVTT